MSTKSSGSSSQSTMICSPTTRLTKNTASSGKNFILSMMKWLNLLIRWMWRVRRNPKELSQTPFTPSKSETAKSIIATRYWSAWKSNTKCSKKERIQLQDIVSNKWKMKSYRPNKRSQRWKRKLNNSTWRIRMWEMRSWTQIKSMTKSGNYKVRNRFLKGRSINWKIKLIRFINQLLIVK